MTLAGVFENYFMKDETQKTLKEILAEAMNLKGLSVFDLSELTGIPEYYLRAIIEEDASKLPPAPYVRGYLVKLAEVLNMDGNRLWLLYRKLFQSKISGHEDKLPQNRFAFKKIKKSGVVFIIIGIFVIIYGVFRLSHYLSAPLLEIGNPPADNFISDSPVIELRGKIDSSDKLTINREEIIVDKNGYFKKDFLLDKGINSVEFSAKRVLGKEIKITRKIIYQPE